MALIKYVLFFAILAAANAQLPAEEASVKMSKALPYPKKYQVMTLKKYRPEPEETQEPTTTEEPKDPSSTTTESSTGVPPVEEEVPSDENEMNRKKKHATTTFCVEIRPSNPYQKPFQVCEPLPQGYEQNNHHPAPPSHHQVHQQDGANFNQMSSGYKHPEPVYYMPPKGYNQPQHQLQPQPRPRPVRPNHQVYAPSISQSNGQSSSEGGQVDQMNSPMVLPHVPVAEPYHIPTTIHQHRPPAGYRTSWDGQGSPAEVTLVIDEAQPRSSYDDSYDSSNEKTQIYDYHKKKEISYLPLITKSYQKTKPMDFLKVLKDLKKNKYQVQDNYNDHKKHDSNPHGLVITCQPSAVGYTGKGYQQYAPRYGGSQEQPTMRNLYGNSQNSGISTSDIQTILQQIGAAGLINQLGGQMGGQLNQLGLGGQLNQLGLGGQLSQLALARQLNQYGTTGQLNQLGLSGQLNQMGLTQMGGQFGGQTTGGQMGGQMQQMGQNSGYVPPATYRNADPGKWSTLQANPTATNEQVGAPMASQPTAILQPTIDNLKTQQRDMATTSQIRMTQNEIMNAINDIQNAN